MSVTAAAGFVAAGVACGIKASGDPDLSLVATADGLPVVATAVFTDNKMTAAPVLVSESHLRTTLGRAVDAQALRPAMHGDEQQADVGIDHDVAEALEHAVAVVVGECEFGRAGDGHEARHAALERAIGLADRRGSGEEEEFERLDEGLVVFREFGVAEALFETIGQRSRTE